MSTQRFPVRRIAVSAIVVLTGLAGCMTQGGSSSPSPGGLPAPGLPSGMPPSPGMPGSQGSGQPSNPSSNPSSGQSGRKRDTSQNSGSGKSSEGGSQSPGGGGMSCKDCPPDPRGEKSLPGGGGGPPGMPGGGTTAGIPKKGDVRDTPNDGSADSGATTGSADGGTKDPEYGALPGSGKGSGDNTKDDPLATGTTPGEDGWVTSNEVPYAGDGSAPADKAGNGAEEGSATGKAGDSAAGTGDGSGKDSVLDDALDGLDGEIMSERAVIRERNNKTAGTKANAGAADTTGDKGSSANDDLPASGGGSNDGMVPGGTASSPSVAGVPSNRNRPPAPRSSTAGSVPDDIPVGAHDDDIIARQLREAAMQETNPELREKLWEEYRRYKGM